MLHYIRCGFGNRRNGLISEKRLMTPDTRQSYTGLETSKTRMRAHGNGYGQPPRLLYSVE
ncbi:hypothetical protein M758_7G073700 [Ceratodon purpureus]|uniref:Uncharacterized protein n=1 Tax=Ceratodon purpureus TaxID=3225 RepID=A0A8T0H3Q4_CERPU|nr:hypothetical protein KC19_7G070700 [Ceratodon purpureus]KAG0610539.1 hypothetical protein M758_7G073700 [Ceratodon purpureus]